MWRCNWTLVMASWYGINTNHDVPPFALHSLPHFTYTNRTWQVATGWRKRWVQRQEIFFIQGCQCSQSMIYVWHVSCFKTITYFHFLLQFFHFPLFEIIFCHSFRFLFYWKWKIPCNIFKMKVYSWNVFNNDETVIWNQHFSVVHMWVISFNYP